MLECLMFYICRQPYKKAFDYLLSLGLVVTPEALTLVKHLDLSLSYPRSTAITVVRETYGESTLEEITEKALAGGRRLVSHPALIFSFREQVTDHRLLLIPKTHIIFVSKPLDVGGKFFLFGFRPIDLYQCSVDLFPYNPKEKLPRNYAFAFEKSW